MNTKPSKVFNISAMQQAVRYRKQNLLFLHTMTGCGDITSALYRQGTKKAFGLRMSNDYIPGYEVKVFNSETLSPAAVSVKGKKFVLALYGGQRLATLDEYRYYAYNRNIASQLVERDLPPTEWGRRYLCIDYIYCDSDMDVAISVCLRMSTAYYICLVVPTHRFIFDITSSCCILINKIVNIV